IDQCHVIPSAYLALTQDGSKAVKVFNPNNFVLGWKLATDDSSTRGDGVVRIMFDDNPDSQVLSLEVVGVIGGSAIRSG
ncbi:MAG: hypothetical protein EZS28_032757, partial [Streblomastix strix]